MNIVKESVWGNISKRSEGGQERKEDSLKPFEKRIISVFRAEDFAEKIVYESNYRNNVESYKNYIKDFYKNEVSSYINSNNMDIVLLYIENDWNNITENIKKKIDEEEEYVKSKGFKKGMFKSILATLNDWWKSLDEDMKDDVLYNHNKHAEENDFDTYSNNVEFWRWSNYHEKIESYAFMNNTNESVWGNISKRADGTMDRKESEDPEMKQKIMSYCRWFAERIVYEDAYKNDLDDFKKFLYERNKSYTNYYKRLQRMIGYVEVRWLIFEGVIDKNIKEFEKRVESQGFKKVPGESISDTLEKWWNTYEYKYEELEAVNNDLDDNERFRTEDEMWSQWDYDEKIECYMNAISQTNECDGVPGGLTPADVGGMGPAYFPGPNGEPGSGDLPMPTGHVYQQVAPFSGFIKMKKSKKKKKKFRKEDEPCVHSPNAKVYDYVDDYREYVDRTYNNMDRK